MRKGISLYFGYVNENKETVYKLIKEAGFEYVMTNFDERFAGQHGTMNEQIAFMKKYGLKPDSLHARYTTAELPDFWKDTELGDTLEARLKEDVLNASKFGFCAVVVHLAGTYSKIGEARLIRVLELCEKVGVPLAIENINFPEIFKTVFEKINHPYLKMCYDSGHNNVFDKQTDYLTLYRDKIVCLHLHDNNGLSDEHTLNRFGTINWEELAKKLALLPNDVVLCYEMLMHSRHDVLMEDCLSETFRQANELEKMIEKYRKTSSK